MSCTFSDKTTMFTKMYACLFFCTLLSLFSRNIQWRRSRLPYLNAQCVVKVVDCCCSNSFINNKKIQEHLHRKTVCKLLVRYNMIILLNFYFIHIYIHKTLKPNVLNIKEHLIPLVYTLLRMFVVVFFKWDEKCW